MGFRLSNLLDLGIFQTFAENLWKITSIPMSLIDMDGNPLTCVGEQQFCLQHQQIEQYKNQRFKQKPATTSAKLNPKESAFFEIQCRIGFKKAIQPVWVEGNHIASIVLGPYASETSGKNQLQSELKNADIDSDTLLRLLDEVPACSYTEIFSLMELYSNQVGLMIQINAERLQNLRTLKQLRHQKAILHDQNQELLYLHSQRVPHGKGLDSYFDSLLSTLIRTLKVDRAHLWLIESKGQTGRCIAVKGPDANLYESIEVCLEDCPVYLSHLRTELCIVSNDTSSDPRLIELFKTELEPRRVLSLLDIPIRRGNKLLAVLCLGQIEKKRRWTVEDENFARSLAQLIAVAIGDEQTLAAQKELQESEYRLRALFEKSAVPMAILSPEGETLQANPALCRMLGYCTEELTAKRFRYFIPPDGARHSFLYRFDRLTDGHIRFFDMETRLLKKSGHTAWGRLTANWVWDRQNYPAFIILVIEDITERKKAEQYLFESKERYHALAQEFEALLDGLPDVLIHLSRDRKIIWANHAATQLNAQKDTKDEEPSTNTAIPCYQVIQNRSEPCGQCLVLKCFSEGEPQEGLKRTPDGKQWGVKVFPIFSTDKIPTSVIILAADITEKNRLREEADQTNRLASLGELAAGVAHEINNPNGLLLMNTELLQKVLPEIHALLENQYQSLGDFPMGPFFYSDLRDILPVIFSDMHGASKRIQKMVEDLRNFARPVNSEDKKAFSLNEALSTAIRLSGHTIRKTTAGFQSHFEEEIPNALGLFNATIQVAINLIVNACQALTDSDQALVVSTFYDSNYAMVGFSVQDEGKGIDPKDLPHITEAFFTTRTRDGGTGLGLSISKRIINEQNGKLLFESTPDKGTTARVLLPAAEPQL